MRHRSGFTLLELLVAAALAGMVVLLSAQVLAQAAEAHARVGRVGADTGALRRAFETINRDLHSATVPPDASGLAFELTSEAGTGTESLRFAAVIGEPLLAGPDACETALVEYVVAEDPRSGRPTLWRYETAYPVPENASEAAEARRATPLLPGVIEVAYLFYSADRQSWDASWDGEEGLPGAVRIDLTIGEPDGRGTGRTESWIVSLPAASPAPPAEEDAETAQ